MAKGKGKQAAIFEQRKPWADNDHLIWLVSTISLARNVEKYHFPAKLDTNRQKQVVSLVNKEIPNFKSLENAQLLRAEKVSPLEKEYLVEHFLTTESFHQSQTGQAFIIDNSGRFLGTVNIEDHLNLTLLDITGELETTWNDLVEMEMALGRAFAFSFTQRFGFLTSDPMHCGTGLKVAVYLQLSGLIHTDKLEGALEKYSDENIALSGLHGSPNEIIGDILVIENNYTLGLTEENIISNIRSFCTKLQMEEKTVRKAIQEEGTPSIKDKVSRAYGILVHSYQIEAVEALNALSLLKLGITFDWVKGMTIKELNELFFNCRRAHLLCQYKEEVPQEEILHKRAEYIHEHLKKVTLTV